MDGARLATADQPTVERTPRTHAAKAGRRRNRGRDLTLLLMGLPALVQILIFAYLPMFGLVIAGYFVFGFLSANPPGWVNRLIASMGLDSIRWYQSAEYWPGILTIVHLWKNIGFWSIVYLAGILGISPEYYEAAKIDGATKLQQIVYVTLPLLVPLIVTNLLLQVGRIFYADFGLFYNVTQDQPALYRTTDVIDTFVYRSLRQLSNVSMAAAAGFYQAVVGLVLISLVNWIVRRINPERALF